MTTDELLESLSDIEIEETKDGSPTLFVPSMDEHYHSTFGAKTESLHIFVERALKEWYRTNGGHCNVLEVGFGTGLNALLTLLEAERSGLDLTYHTYEIKPLDAALIERMWRDALTEEEWEWMKQIHLAEWDIENRLSPHFTLLKHREDLLTAHLPKADVIYMDAFAPEKTPELWQDHFLQKLYLSAKDGACFSTYCAKGAVRRTLQATGFEVHRTPGPPGGKREILTATKMIKEGLN